MHRREYQEHRDDSTVLLHAVEELRELSRLEFIFDNVSDGLLLAQLSIDLQRLSAGAFLRSACLRRTFSAQFPRFFQMQGGEHE